MGLLLILAAACGGRSTPDAGLALAISCFGRIGCDGGMQCVSPRVPNSTTAGLCAQPCPNGASDCPEGQACVLASLACGCCNCACAAANVCIPAGQVRGEACDAGAACLTGLICVSGACQVPCQPSDAGVCTTLLGCGFPVLCVTDGQSPPVCR
jgi:hypothetical protein